MKIKESVLHTDEVGKIIEDLREAIPDGYGIEISDNGDIGGIGIKTIFEEIVLSIKGEIGPISKFFMLAVGLAILVCVARFICFGRGEKTSEITEIGVCTVASVSLFSPLYAICMTVKESLLSIINLISSILPVMTLVNTSMGAGESAAAQAVGLNFTLFLLEKLSLELLLPLSLTLFTLSFVSSFASGGISLVIRGIKNTYSWGVGVISAALAAIVTMQGVVASARDSALLRAARYAAGSMIPVVGNTVASALATLGGGLALVKSSVGVSAVVIILLTALSPLICLLGYRAALSLAILFLEFSETEGGVRCFSAFRTALDSVIASFCAACLVVLIQLAVFLFGGVKAA